MMAELLREASQSDVRGYREGWKAGVEGRVASGGQLMWRV
jgi:hypothetical protein